MITSRITSGFDIELQLGGGWFRTALDLLIDKGVINTGGLPITNAQVIMDPDWDLQIDVLGLPAPVLALVALNQTGTILTITTNRPEIPAQQIPFGALRNLAEPPVKTKLAGNAEHQNVIAVLANLDIHAESQTDEPLPAGQFLDRGDPAEAQSFLPLGEHIAFGMGDDTLDRFANNIWHTSLRADDGSHPLPDEENRKGEWSGVTCRAESGSIKVVLEGDVPIDSPIIDVVPDGHVTVTLTLTPVLDSGRLSFTISADTDFDTGLLGDLFGALTGSAAGAIVGLIVGVFTGGLLIVVLIGAGIGLAVGVIAVEVVEFVVEGIVNRQIKAKIDGDPIPDINSCHQAVVHIATPDTDSAFNLAVLDAIPSSIAVHNENPAGELLYRDSFLVVTAYDDLAADVDGFGAAGGSSTGELSVPEVVSITSFDYAGDVLQGITYARTDGRDQSLPIGEVLSRATNGELVPPITILPEPAEATLRVPLGKLACMCLRVSRIRREETVIRELEFEGGSRVSVADAVALQDGGAIRVLGLQLIHPRGSNAYFRAPADGSTDNNLESRPRFG